MIPVRKGTDSKLRTAVSSLLPCAKVWTHSYRPWWSAELKAWCWPLLTRRLPIGTTITKWLLLLWRAVGNIVTGDDIQTQVRRRKRAVCGQIPPCRLVLVGGSVICERKHRLEGKNSNSATFCMICGQLGCLYFFYKLKQIIIHWVLLKKN